MDLKKWKDDFEEKITKGIERFFDDFDWLPERYFHRKSEFFPFLDLSETDDAYIVKLDVPGVEQKDIKISLKDNILTVSGEKKEEREEKQKGYYRVERRYGSFSRSVRLPSDIIEDNIRANYKSGVLTIKVAKKEEQKGKDIKVEWED